MKTKNSIITLLIIISSFPAFSQGSLLDSLVLHLPFDGDTLDISGNGNHASLNGAIFAPDRNGISNSAVQLDGVDDFITVLNNQKLKPQLPLTISTWVLYDNTNNNPIFRNDWQEDYYHGVWLAINGNLISATFADGGPVGPYSRRTKRTTEPLSPNVWYHVAAVIRGVGDADIYVNGRNYCGDYNGSGGSLDYTNDDGRIGNADPFANPGPLTYFSGKIDDLRLYSRELLVSEIEELAEVDAISMTIDSVCTGNVLSVSAPSGFQTYSWLPAPGLFSHNCTSCQTVSVSPPDTTTYTVVLEVFPGCVDTFTVQVNVVECCKAEFTGVLENVQQPTCPTDSLGGFIIYGTSGNAPYQYSLNGAPFVNSGIFNSLPPATYFVTVKDSADCEIDTLITILAPPTSIITQINSTGETVFGANDGTAKVIPTGGNGAPWFYSWSNGAITDSVGGLAPGTYTVTVTDGAGCSQTDSVTIPGVRLSMESFPEGSNWSISPNPGAGELHIHWDLPVGSEPELSLMSITGQTIKQQSFLQPTGSTFWNLNLPEGVYLFTISTKEYQEVKKVILRK